MEKHMLSGAKGLQVFKEMNNTLDRFLFLDSYDNELFLETVSHIFDSPESLIDFLRKRKRKEKEQNISFKTLLLKDLNTGDAKMMQSVVTLDKYIESAEASDFNAMDFIASFDKKKPEKIYSSILEGVYYELVEVLLFMVIPSVKDVYKIAEDCSDRDGFSGKFSPESLRGLPFYKTVLKEMEEQYYNNPVLVEVLDKFYCKMKIWNDLNKKYFSSKRREALQGGWNLDVFLSSYFQHYEWRNLINSEVSEFYRRVRNEIKLTPNIIEESVLKDWEEKGDFPGVDATEDLVVTRNLLELEAEISERFKPFKYDLQDEEELFLRNQKTLGYKKTLRLLLVDFIERLEIRGLEFTAAP